MRIDFSARSVILEDEQLEYLCYYNKLTGTTISEIVRETMQDWIVTSYPSRVYKIENERGLPPSTTEAPPLPPPHPLALSEPGNA